MSRKPVGECCFFFNTPSTFIRRQRGRGWQHLQRRSYLGCAAAAARPYQLGQSRSCAADVTCGLFTNQTVLPIDWDASKRPCQNRLSSLQPEKWPLVQKFRLNEQAVTILPPPARSQATGWSARHRSLWSDHESRLQPRFMQIRTSSVFSGRAKISQRNDMLKSISRVKGFGDSASARFPRPLSGRTSCAAAEQMNATLTGSSCFVGSTAACLASSLEPGWRAPTRSRRRGAGRCQLARLPPPLSCSAPLNDHICRDGQRAAALLRFGFRGSVLQDWDRVLPTAAPGASQPPSGKLFPLFCAGAVDPKGQKSVPELLI